MNPTDLAFWVVIAAAPPANLFPVLYTAWTNWWHSPAGRHLFWFTVGLAMLIDLSLLRRGLDAFGMDFPGYDWLVVAVFVVICWQLYRRLWLLITNNSRRARQAREQATVRLP